MQQAFDGQVQFVGVAGRADAAEVAEFVERREVSAFPHAFDGDGEVWSRYGVSSQPAFAFLNDDGTFSTNLGALGVDGLTSAANQLLET